MSYDYDMLVIGGGSAALTAAGMASVLGAKTALLRRRSSAVTASRRKLKPKCAGRLHCMLLSSVFSKCVAACPQPRAM